MAEQRYEIKITASGTVRDADGNVLNQDTPIEGSVIVTESQLRELMQQQQTLTEGEDS